MKNLRTEKEGIQILRKHIPNFHLINYEEYLALIQTKEFNIN